MKISTAFLFDRATERMSTIQNKLATTQAQLSVSKQVLSPRFNTSSNSTPARAPCSTPRPRPP